MPGPLAAPTRAAGWETVLPKHGQGCTHQDQGKPKALVAHLRQCHNPRSYPRPRPGTGARILITTRWANWHGQAEPIEVDLLTTGEAIDLLLRSTGRKDREGAGRLAKLWAISRSPSIMQAPTLQTPNVVRPVRRSRPDLIAKAPEGTAYPKASSRPSVSRSRKRSENARPQRPARLPEHAGARADSPTTSSETPFSMRTIAMKRWQLSTASRWSNLKRTSFTRRKSSYLHSSSCSCCDAPSAEGSRQVRSDR